MKIVNILVAIASGIIVLIGYFFPETAIKELRRSLLDWSVVLAGVAALVAILNLVFGVHWRRLKQEGKTKGFSLIIIAGFIITVVFGIILGPYNEKYQNVVTAIQLPIESSLMAVLAFTLALSSLKILKRHRNWMGILFFASVIIFLVLSSGVLSMGNEVPLLKDLLSAFHQIPVAGGRGILLGIALGSMVTGIRVLIGSDRPYNG